MEDHFQTDCPDKMTGTHIRYARSEDIDWLQHHDDLVSLEWINRSVENSEYILAERHNEPLGYLRYSYFWGKIPFMDMIFVLADHRYDGVGSAMLKFWERAMIQKHATVLMTSSELGELEPQAWHRRNGYKECGQLALGRYQSSPEVFFIKECNSRDGV